MIDGCLLYVCDLVWWYCVLLVFGAWCSLGFCCVLIEFGLRRVVRLLVIACCGG